MRTLIALLVIAFATTVQAAEHDKVYTCLTEDGQLIKYNANFGEMSVMKKDGTVVMDHDDGYDEKVTYIETFPVTIEISVFHHEEPETTILEFSYMDPHAAPHSGYFRTDEGKVLNINCL